MNYTRIVPLGGVGDDGMNCLALETRDGIIVVDCGVARSPGRYGVDAVRPDLRYLAARRDALRGVLITHGHEGSLGALSQLLAEAPAPVWAPPYALGLIRSRLAGGRPSRLLDLRQARPREPFEVGPFRVEPLRVTHSVPDALAFAIDTPAGRVVHTGDFKLDRAPPDGQPADEARLQALGDEGVAVLLSDSMGSDVAGRAGREADVAGALAEVVTSLARRVVVAIPGSNISRLQSVANLAAATDRRLCLFGHALRSHARIARGLGFLRLPEGLMIDPVAAMSVRPRRLLCVTADTRGDARGMLARLARDDAPYLSLAPGDAVVRAAGASLDGVRARVQLVCALERRGVQVYDATTIPALHASGHAAREEQAQMVSLLRPRAFVPVRGTFHHLRRHADLAASLGVREVRVLENGQTARWEGGRLTRDADVPSGRTMLQAGAPLAPAVGRERAAMAAAGVIKVAITLDDSGGLAAAPHIVGRGVSAIRDARAAREVRGAVEAAIAGRASASREVFDGLVQRAVANRFRASGQRPLVIVEVRSARADAAMERR